MALGEEVIRYRNPRSGIVHNADDNRLVTHCGVATVDLFATYDYGLMTMDQTAEPTTCKICLRGGVKGCRRTKEGWQGD